MKLYLAACVLALSAAPLASAAELISISSNGSACPIQNASSIPYGFDGEWLSLALHEAISFEVKKGPDISLEESRKNCAFTLRLRTPGYRYAVERVLSWGSYQLADDDQFVFNLNGFFAGSRTAFTVNAVASGPNDSMNFGFDQTLHGSQLVWSSCGQERELTLNSSVRVSPSLVHPERDGQSNGSVQRLAIKFRFEACR